MLYEFIYKRSFENRIFIQELPFIHFGSGANALIWSEKKELKQLYFIDNYTRKKMIKI